MRSHTTAVLSLLLSLPAGVAQATATSPAAQSPAAPGAPAGPPSSVVQPSLTNLEQALGTVDVDRWKLPKQAREDARRNIDSIRQDLTATLPPLMTAADAAPGSATAEFAMLRNVDALYDVALRLSATAAVAAPGAQAAALDQALGGLLVARRSLGDRTQADAAAQAHTIAELQGRLRATVAATPTCPTPAPTAAETKSKVRRSKPKPKPVSPPAPPQ